ncbi:unnamed protein product [Rhizoctonia solani]|uniref:Uncharacterized protein n=1 Tax=Rhizoctonia solani TaxID=456999 RepID=A0A8H3H1D8_9AGAM|nr:unnamed protein product [Rhizoctonia solani]
MMATEAITEAEQRKIFRRLPGVSVYNGSAYRASMHPGASGRPSMNVIIKTIRKKGKIQELAMSFDSWTKDNDTFNWYEERKQTENGRRRYIRTMHLRKERQRPFYHEFVVLHLHDGTFWRIDRRQLPDEQDPYGCTKECGVPACDTIERVSGMTNFLEQNPITSSSHCIVELEFKEGINVDVALVLRICRAIKNHGGSKVYTLQRYNCFFFAQALIMCTACGVSDWAGWGQSNQSNCPWKSPNAPFAESPEIFGLGNKNRLESFKWKPSNTFSHDWKKLSELSNKLVHASPLLRHADHCNYCLESQTTHHQRSLSSEINRLKQRLGIYWNGAYRELLEKALLANYKTLVGSGVWGVVSQNNANEECENVFLANQESIRKSWMDHYESEFKTLVDVTHDLLDPTEACKAWYPDPDEWGSVWSCKDGGPVVAAKSEWEKSTKEFFGSEISHLEEALRTQAAQVSFDAQAVAMAARAESFNRVLNIKTRLPKKEEGIIIPGATLVADKQSLLSAAGRTTRSRTTFITIKSMVTVRAKKMGTCSWPFFQQISRDAGCGY